MSNVAMSFGVEFAERQEQVKTRKLYCFLTETENNSVMTLHFLKAPFSYLSSCTKMRAPLNSCTSNEQKRTEK